jgi:hypothetical protein
MTMRLMTSVAVIALTLTVASGAGAFTVENRGGNAGGGEPGFINPDDGVQRLVDPSVSSSRRMRRDLLDPTRDPDRLPPIPESARIGAGEHGFGNNSRFGYDRSGRPR